MFVIFPSISYRFHLLFIDSLIICIFEFHNMRQYWKSVIMMLVYSVLLSVTNYCLTFLFFAYDSCVFSILFVNPIMLATAVLNFEHSAPC